MRKSNVIVLLLLLSVLCGCAEDPVMAELYRARARWERNQLKPLTQLSVAEMFPGNPQAQALAKAASKGDVKKIDQLIDAGADPNAPTVYGETLPIWVMLHPNKAGFRRLLERGADPNREWRNMKMPENQRYSTTLLDMATARVKLMGTDYLKMCLEIGHGDPNLSSLHLRRPIQTAVHLEDRAAFAVLYKAGASVDYEIHDDTPDALFHSYIQCAAFLSNYRLVLFLLENGVNYSIKGKSHPQNLQETMQIELWFGFLSRSPNEEQYMWFWRCVDFLEKRGVVFSFTQNPKCFGEICKYPIIRPKVLDTTPTDYLNAPPPPPKKKLPLLWRLVR